MSDTLAPAGMLLLDSLTAGTAQQMAGIRGTGLSLTVDVKAPAEEMYYQMASYKGDAVLIEIPGAALLHRGVSDFDQAWLGELGFTPPDDDMPNWWIGMEHGHDHALQAAARATVRALVEVLNARPHELAESLGLELPQGTRVPVEDNPLIAELLILDSEFANTVVERQRMVVYPHQAETAVLIHGDGLLYEVLYLGPPYDDGTIHWDDSELSVYLKSRESGVSFSMFPDPAAIAQRLRCALGLQRGRANVWAPNPFKRPFRRV
ncbi:hypothetical protein [Tessaracoccus sp. MC1756]|uniref:TY-Chap domain-containing protein n=1 Tax=Tessaracoccus sp. MC1756 TaxID=2760311 RepID=UPI0015FF7D28|nr:hypothetical protein [Tessaracoccus sp. MC1756]MBB1510614.1 hypothetical protein [Tessaracoccus sp. MC1756]